MFRGRVRQVHFIGVGGVGMSGLAEVLCTLGFEVSGSDLRDGDVVRRLSRLGVRVHLGHRESNVAGADVVVYSTAIPKQNPEVQEAVRMGIPIISRGEMLAELMRVKYAVAIAGSHGKTTTTSLVATVLGAAGLDPTVLVGGRMANFGSNARLGQGDLFVAEADESDGSFLRLTPTIAVVTNIDPEHLDYYGTHDNLKTAFLQFVEKVPFYGLAVLCLDHPDVQELLPRVRRRHVTYGLSPQADYSATDLRARGVDGSFTAMRRGEALGDFHVRLPGKHNVLNCLAAIAIADELEVPLDVIREALSSFKGVGRRFSVTDEIDGITLVDDYGHHPAEIAATLEAASDAFPGRVLVAFQPHRYSRTEHLFEEFTRCFNKADVLYVTDVYPAGEAPIEGIDSGTLTAAIRQHGHQAATYVGDRRALAQALAREARPGDVVLSLGAGDINKVLPEIASELCANDEAAAS